MTYIEIKTNLANMGFPLNDFWVNDDTLFIFPVSAIISYRLYNKLIKYGFKCKLSEYMTVISIEIKDASPSKTFYQIIEHLNREYIEL